MRKYFGGRNRVIITGIPAAKLNTPYLLINNYLFILHGKNEVLLHRSIDYISDIINNQHEIKNKLDYSDYS